MAKNSRRFMTVLRHERLRERVRGTGERPRLAVYRSETNIYAQVIDDVQGRTLVAANTLQKGVVGKKAAPIEAAKSVGAAIAARAKEQGISKVVFDRGGGKYHGRVKALADSAREAGLEF